MGPAGSLFGARRPCVCKPVPLHGGEKVPLARPSYFLLNFLLKWAQRTCHRAAMAKLQLQSNPGLFLFDEKPHYPGWKKIPPAQGCKDPGRGGAAQHPGVQD